MNLRLRFTRALQSVFSSSRRTNHSTSTPIVNGVAFGLLGSCLIGLGVSLHAESRAVAPAASPAPTATRNVAALAGQRYVLHMHHLHTGESIDVVYRIGDTYLPSALAQLNYFLRDHRTQDESHYDPKEFDLLHSMMTKLGKPNGVIDVVCGYRTPWSNNFLRTRGGRVAPSVTGVAQHSQHMLAKAIDIKVPGVTTRHLRDIAMSFQAGGVGYYPVSQFVHVDVGPVRHWSFGGANAD